MFGLSRTCLEFGAPDAMLDRTPKGPDCSAKRARASAGASAQRCWSKPRNRTFTPDADVLARAALLSGTLCRLQGYQKDARLRALHDCVLFLQAQKLGFAVLTANVADFDYLLQLVPTGRVLLYRRA